MDPSAYERRFPNRLISACAVLGLTLVVAGAHADPNSERKDAGPRIVLPAFVVRCDTTPDQPPLRVARPGYCVNVHGVATADPAADPKVPVLEPDPELRWEAFDEYWRKIHGPKIIHLDGAGDHVTQLLVRYEQQHRIPGGPTSSNAPPYPAQVDANNLLVTDPHARVKGYQRPSSDGLAQLAFETRRDFNAFFGVLPGDKYLDKIVPDEKIFLKGFVFNISKEFIIIPDAGVRDPIILVKTLQRGPQFSSREQFQKVWLKEHSKLVTSNSTARKLVGRYAQLHNISVPSDGAFYDPVGDQYDVIEVLSFGNPTQLEQFLSSKHYQKIAADDAKNTVKTEFFTAVNYVIKIDDIKEKITTINDDSRGRGDD